MPHTTFSPEDLQAGQELADEGKVEDILFSEGTYQVSIKGAGKGLFWPFLQITDEGTLKDHFCTCAEAEAGGPCPHQAAAWIKIFSGHEEPLHVRFRDSLWTHLCQMAARRHGYETKCLKGSLQTQFQAFSTTKKKLFSLKALNPKGKAKLKEIIVDRKMETEETSLKFSNISLEELTMWKEGRPSHLLSYELSFWSDLAKWWMIQQDAGKKYKIAFKYDKEVLPKEISVHFEDMECSFYIAEANWPQIIPALAHVDAPLKTFEFSNEQIRRIFYDPLRKVFNLDIIETEKEEKPAKVYPIGEWSFVPDKGFYPSKLDPLLNEKVIHSSQIGEFLHRHQHLVETHLVGSKLHLNPVRAKYHLFFDANQALHLVCYAFDKGDLQRPSSARYGSWIYLSDKGFFLLEDVLFEETEKVIPKEEVADFVSHHRHWLHAYEGFQTHVIAIESRLTYTLTKEELRFDSGLELAEEAEEVIDFNEWIYVRGRGFYSKMARRLGHGIAAGLKIPRNEIGEFIRGHQDDLENINGFFAVHSPLLASGLHVFLSDEGAIVVRPQYTFLPTYQNKKIEIFENYTYVEGEGFHEVPGELRLPDRYFKEVTIEESLEPYFVAYEIDTLQPSITEIDPRLQKPHDLFLKINSFKREPDGSWLLDLEYESNVGSIDVMSIWEALNVGKRHLFSPAGLILLKSPRYNWLKGIPKKRWMKKGKQIRLTTLEWIKLFVFEEIKEPDDPASLKNWNEFKNFEPATAFDITGLKSELRGYQETGLKWLWFLYSQGLSGLLCDEMGLGKTHQAMALLAAASNLNPAGKYLVVCPTSVIFHWEDLLKKFLPRLRVYVYYGAQRTLVDFNEHYDLLLTSYGTLRSEKSPLSEIPFDISIYDEIQIAKNASSQTHKALKLINATVRLGLTGTPIENNLLELKSLFDVVLPDYMPTETLYKELFVNPIEKQNDHDKKYLLARFIRPFVLRRKKSEVLLELPEKTETLAYAPLSVEQKTLYREVYRSSKEQLFKELQDDSKPTPYLHVFALLTKLKQICDHPALFKNEIDSYKKYASGKWDLFVELLNETRESGQKLVVFSQYLGMLDIIESYLEEHKIGFAGIRGSTRDRKAQVEKFRDDPKCEVFIGSLQAAGVGIDLISASVVIHYDRWWNPAKENQATDRVHRMGQSRGVQVFKMITRGTIEEHIHVLIEKKLGLMEQVIGFDEETQVKVLTREDLLELLQLMDNYPENA
jgi:superfamily II DNA or RNA helicase